MAPGRAMWKPHPPMNSSIRRSFALASFGLCLAVSFSLAAADTPVESGFTPLFNGKNLDGWQNGRSKTPAPETFDGKAEAFGGRFAVSPADGVLTIDPAVKGDLYLSTQKTFAGDVVIRLEFNAGPKCNNDVFLRGSKFDIVPGLKDTAKVAEGVWSTLEIIVSGDKIEHKIDGVTVRSAAVSAKAGATPFMLRAEFGTIRYRNVRYREG